MNFYECANIRGISVKISQSYVCPDVASETVFKLGINYFQLEWWICIFSISIANMIHQYVPILLTSSCSKQRSISHVPIKPVHVITDRMVIFNFRRKVVNVWPLIGRWFTCFRSYLCFLLNNLFYTQACIYVLI